MAITGYLRQSLLSPVQCQPPLRITSEHQALFGIEWTLATRGEDIWPRPAICTLPDSIFDNLRWGHGERVIGSVLSDILWLVSWWPGPWVPGVIWWWSGHWWWHWHWTIQTPGNIYIYFIFVLRCRCLMIIILPLSQGALQLTAQARCSDKARSVINPSIRLFKSFSIE